MKGLIILLTGFLLAGCAYTSGSLSSTKPTASPTSTLTNPGVFIMTETLVPAQVSSKATQAVDLVTPTATAALVSSATSQPTASPAPTSVETTQATATPTPVETIQATSTPTSVAIVQATAAPTSTPAQPSPTPAATDTQQPASTQGQSTASAGSSPCQNKAGFFGDVTIPDDTLFRQGDAFVKTWQFRNEGTCTWGPAYSLIFLKGDQMGGPASIPLPTVKPGDTFQISVKLVAPSQGGTYMGVYEFQDSQGTKFGVNTDGIDKFWVKIDVAYLGPTPTPGAAVAGAACPAQAGPDYVAQVIALVNQARAAAGVPPLTENPLLDQAAQVHSLDMACTSNLSHKGSDGSLWNNRIQAQGYHYSYASENIYAGSPAYGGDAAGAMDWWMHSQVHRDNILSNKVTEIGVGYAYYTESQYGGYFTIDFGKP